MARDCDIYIGVYGPRYGYIDPETGMSATELEYRHARQGNPNKVFIYLKDGGNPDPDKRRFFARYKTSPTDISAMGGFRTLSN
jgi:hypothetical protein